MDRPMILNTTKSFFFCGLCFYKNNFNGITKIRVKKQINQQS